MRENYEICLNRWLKTWSLDVSKSATEQMIARTSLQPKCDTDTPNVQYITLDARDLGEKTLVPPNGPVLGKFDVCIDKGLVDALWCSGVDGTTQIPEILRSVASVLQRPKQEADIGVAGSRNCVSVGGGRFLMLTYSSPLVLMPLFAESITTVMGCDEEIPRGRANVWSNLEVRKLKSMYLYIFTRGEDACDTVDPKTINVVKRRGKRRPRRFHARP